MTPEEDLFLILAVAKAESDGRKIPYCPALQLAYARTITFMSEHPEMWVRKEKP